MASLEARKPLVSNHHGDGPGSIGRLINPISHRSGHDAQNKAGHQQGGRTLGPSTLLPHATFQLPPPSPTVNDQSAVTVLLTWASCGGNVVLREPGPASHHDESFPESSAAVAPLWCLCAPFIRCVVLKGNGSNCLILLPRRFMSSSRVV